MEPTAAVRASILLVDDQPQNLVELQAILAPLGHDSVTRQSVEEALREVARREFALIFLDAGMIPAGDADILGRIRKSSRARPIPIVFVTNGHDPGPGGKGDLSSVASAPGTVDVLARPFDPEVVRSKASVFVDLYAKGKKIRSQERLLRRREREIHQAILTRDEFLSVASHELRTPLTSLKLEVANILRLARRGEANTDGRLISRMERIDAQVTRLHRLIDDLLDVSRIATGSLELELEQVDLAEVANEVGLRFEDEAARLGSPIAVRAPATTVGYWDRSRLDQVITSLVSNAIKYGEGKPIDVSVEAGDDRAILVVRDSGVGIAPQDHERIFGRFERAASSRNYGGIGLGLWIVRRIVDALRGTVTVDSRPGLGLTFTVELPRARISASASGLDVSSVRPPAFGKQIGGTARS